MQKPHPDSVSHGGGGALRVRVSRSNDVVEHAGNLTGWQQQYDQLSAGAFDGRLDQLCCGDIQVFRERTSHALLQRCRIRDDALWCGITAAHDGSRIEGREVGAHGVMVCGRHAEFELLTPHGHDICGIVVPRGALLAHAALLGLELAPKVLEHPTFLTCEPGVHARFRGDLAFLLADVDHGGLNANDPQSLRHLVDALHGALPKTLISCDEGQSATASFDRRSRLVNRVRDYMRAHPDSAPTVTDLCAQFHVSRRTLQYAFEDILGVSPAACLRSLRLNAVRRLLLGGAGTVNEAAARWGFWNLSQFSSDYRRHFGERPSDTLGRTRRSP